jgi:hypothetical protein
MRTCIYVRTAGRDEGRACLHRKSERVNRISVLGGCFVCAFNKRHSVFEPHVFLIRTNGGWYVLLTTAMLGT